MVSSFGHEYIYSWRAAGFYITTLLCIIPNRSLGGYALIRFLFVICFADYRLQWNPIAPSNQQNICSKINADIT